MQCYKSESKTLHKFSYNPRKIQGRKMRKTKQGFVYILFNKPNGALYVGVTSAREKYLKGKKRAFKTKLIYDFNPQWRDLYEDLF